MQKRKNDCRKCALEWESRARVGLDKGARAEALSINNVSAPWHRLGWVEGISLKMFEFGNFAYCVVKLYISTWLEYSTLYMSRSTQSKLSSEDVVQSRKYNHVLPYLTFNTEDISYPNVRYVYCPHVPCCCARQSSGNQSRKGETGEITKLPNKLIKFSRFRNT